MRSLQAINTLTSAEDKENLDTSHNQARNFLEFSNYRPQTLHHTSTCSQDYYSASLALKTHNLHSLSTRDTCKHSGRPAFGPALDANLKRITADLTSANVPSSLLCSHTASTPKQYCTSKSCHGRYISCTEKRFKIGNKEASDKTAYLLELLCSTSIQDSIDCKTNPSTRHDNGLRLRSHSRPSKLAPLSSSPMRPNRRQEADEKNQASVPPLESRVEPSPSSRDSDASCYPKDSQKSSKDQDLRINRLISHQFKNAELCDESKSSGSSASEIGNNLVVNEQTEEESDSLEVFCGPQSIVKISCTSACKDKCFMPDNESNGKGGPTQVNAEAACATLDEYLIQDDKMLEKCIGQHELS